MKKILNFDYPEASRRGIRQNFSDLKDRKPDFLATALFQSNHFIDPDASIGEFTDLLTPMQASENSQIY